jgi:hypothetical protein
MKEDVTKSADLVFKDTLSLMQKLEIDYKSTDNPLVAAHNFMNMYSHINFLIGHASHEALAYILRILVHRSMGIILSLELLSDLQNCHQKEFMQFMTVLLRSIEQKEDKE